MASRYIIFLENLTMARSKIHNFELAFQSINFHIQVSIQVETATSHNYYNPHYTFLIKRSVFHFTTLSRLTLIPNLNPFTK